MLRLKDVAVLFSAHLNRNISGIRRFILLWTLCCLGLALPRSLAFASPDSTALVAELKSYVQAKDEAYAWKLVETKKKGGTTIFQVELTSQRWLTEKDVDRPQWKHSLIISRPEKVRSKTAFLCVRGGSYPGHPADLWKSICNVIAERTNTVAVQIDSVPGQSLRFKEIDAGISEDQLIAYTWKKFIETGDGDWLINRPMTKSVVRGMDAAQEFLRSDAGGNCTIDTFVLGGLSKRGWAVWWTAAVDERVVGIVPVVIDILNFSKSIEFQRKMYGAWGEALKWFVQYDVLFKPESPSWRTLIERFDPFSYRERFTMPKLILNASGDEYFPAESAQFYFDDLPSEKFLRYVPNANHSLDHGEIAESAIAFYETILDKDVPRPRYSWYFEMNGSIVVDTVDVPTEVRLWEAYNPTAPDFRVSTIGNAFSAIPLEPSSKGRYVANVKAKKSGYTAFFVELTYKTGRAAPFTVTTEIRVVPKH